MYYNLGKLVQTDRTKKSLGETPLHHPKVHTLVKQT